MRINVLILCIALLVGYAYTVIDDAPKRAPAAASFTFTDINGKTHALNDFKGKIVLINFWASWCAPCVKEFPHLIDAAKKNKDNLVLIALSADTSEDAIKKFIRTRSINAPNIFVALDKDDIAGKKFQTFQLPETYILDQNHKISGKLVGAAWTPAELDAMINSLKKAN